MGQGKRKKSGNLFFKINVKRTRLEDLKYCSIFWHPLISRIGSFYCKMGLLKLTMN